LNGSQKDADYAKDMKLPFKTHDFSCYKFSIQDLPKIFEINIPLIKHFKEIKKIIITLFTFLLSVNFHYFNLQN
jgi:hypothetical protein